MLQHRGNMLVSPARYSSFAPVWPEPFLLEHISSQSKQARRASGLSRCLETSSTDPRAWGNLPLAPHAVYFGNSGKTAALLLLTFYAVQAKDEMPRGLLCSVSGVILSILLLPTSICTVRASAQF